MILGSQEVHLWYVFPDQVTDHGLLSNYEAMMSADEVARQRRFVFEKDRHLYCISRALLRTTLSVYSDVAPAQWGFTENDYGKPEIASPAGLAPLRFNLSHTDGLVACVVAMGRDVGVDVENIERPVAVADLARRYFSTHEAAELEALPADRQCERFFDLWTLKEAYIKARGMGMSIPLDAFSFHLEPEAPVRISFAPDVQDDAATWQFAQFTPTRRHKIAVAVRLPSNLDLKIITRETIPPPC